VNEKTCLSIIIKQCGGFPQLNSVDSAN